MNQPVLRNTAFTTVTPRLSVLIPFYRNRHWPCCAPCKAAHPKRWKSS